MNDFVAIDLETASRFHNSACALGLGFINDGAIAEKIKWLQASELVGRFWSDQRICRLQRPKALVGRQR